MQDGVKLVYNFVLLVHVYTLYTIIECLFINQPLTTHELMSAYNQIVYLNKIPLLPN